MSLLSIFMWIVVFGNIMGALMVAKHDSMKANQIWFVTNPILIGYNIYLGAIEQAVMFLIYWILCILGIKRMI